MGSVGLLQMCMFAYNYVEMFSCIKLRIGGENRIGVRGKNSEFTCF